MSTALAYLPTDPDLRPNFELRCDTTVATIVAPSPSDHLRRAIRPASIFAISKSQSTSTASFKGLRSPKALGRSRAAGPRGRHISCTTLIQAGSAHIGAAKQLTYHHAVGTCAMGPGDDENAVVDADGHAHGAEALLVIDASIMPDVPSANTHVPVVMIAERLADSLKAELRR
jgi:choline dehydrogenase-like flavoprotein